MTGLVIVAVLFTSDLSVEIGRYQRDNAAICEAFPITPRRHDSLSRYAEHGEDIRQVLSKWHEHDVEWSWRIIRRYATKTEIEGLMADVRKLAEVSHAIEQRILNEQGYMTFTKDGKRYAYRGRCDLTPHMWIERKQWYFWCGHPLEVK